MTQLPDIAEAVPDTLPDDVRQIVLDVAGSVGGVADARSLPAEAYTSERFYSWKNMQENALEEYHTTYVRKG